MNINPDNKTVTLSEKKTIDLAKIVENEKRLKEENEKLLGIIHDQNEKIKQLASDNITALNKLDGQNNHIISLASDVLKLKKIDTSDSKKTFGNIYAGAYYEFNNPYYHSGTILLSYLNKTAIYSVGVNPFNNSIIYSASASLKIF